MTDIVRKRSHPCKIVEKREFIWKIENFRELIATDPELENVEYWFDAGDSIGLPTTWKLNFSEDENKLGIYLELLQSPKKVPIVKAGWGFQTLKYEQELTVDEYKENGNGWGYDIFRVDNFTEDNLENGSLVLKIKFSLYRDVPVNGENKRIKFEHECRYEAAEDFHTLLNSGEDTDITFQMKDGQTLKAHANILKARSRVFSAMLQNHTQESSSGIVRIEDVTYEVMKIILTFIYAGKLDDKWEEMIEEIVYAANKYELLSLLKFCDENLAATCTSETAWNLMDFAKLHGLKTAQVEIAEYFETHLKEILKAKIAL